MKLHDRLQRAIDGLPDGSSVSLPVAAIREWLGDTTLSVEPDLTVSEVAEFFHRAPQTVRTWIREGRLDAYRFTGQEYRVTHRALEEFQERERVRGQSQTQ